MGYRPFGRYTQIGGYVVGDQLPDPPADIQREVDPPMGEQDFNRFERLVYRWLAHPRFWPRRRRP